jgi:two-component system response regulator RegA
VTNLKSITRVLLTGDDADFVGALWRHLRREGLTLTKAKDWKDARKKIEDGRVEGASFDLIIADAAMLNGEFSELAGWVKELHPEISMLVVSGLGSRDRMAELVRPGRDAYGCKPLTPQEMASLIDLIDRSRTLYANVKQ